MQIVMAGGTGFLGAGLVDRWRKGGHDVTVLTRRPHRPGEAGWDPGGPAESWSQLVGEADAVVNLSGEPIDAKRWTTARKAVLRASRISTTRALAEAVSRAVRTPSVFINASGIGTYGARGDEPLTEESAGGSGFLAALGQEWEAAARPAAARTRVVLLRTGIVLDASRGALPRMVLPFRLFVGGPLGSGRQYMSWIHREDWLRMVDMALANGAVAGPLNVTAPTPVTNAEFARTLGRVLGRPAVVPAPALALRVVLGEMADMVLTGQRVLPAKAQAAGFEFRYPQLEPALRAIYGRPRG
jgi:uncharacterized protein (TIGR01777 family)